MRHSTTTIIGILLCVTVLGQKRNLPQKGHYQFISKPPCNFSKQTKNLEIIKNDLLGLTTYKTDSSEMFMYAEHFIGFLTGLDNTDEAQRIYLRLDSLISDLFQNGLLTSDLLIRAFNAETKVVNYKGDTLNWTNHVQTRKVKLLNIKRKDLPEDLEDKKGIMLFEIWVTFNSGETGWGSFPIFDLYIKADIDPTPSNLNQYLKKATIKCLQYTKTQI